MRAVRANVRQFPSPAISADSSSDNLNKPNALNAAFDKLFGIDRCIRLEPADLTGKSRLQIFDCEFSTGRSARRFRVESLSLKSRGNRLNAFLSASFAVSDYYFPRLPADCASSLFIQIIYPDVSTRYICLDTCNSRLQSA